MAARNSAMSKAFNEDEFRYRGVLYVLREVESGEFDDLQKLATVTRETSDGEIETIDVALRDRLLLNKSLVKGMPEGGINKLPMRVRANLAVKVSNLHFGLEPDELEAEKKAADEAAKKAPASDEDAPKGNPSAPES